MNVIIILLTLSIICIVIYDRIGYEILYQKDYQFSSRRLGQRGAIDCASVYYERHKLIKLIKRVRINNSYFPYDIFDKNKFIDEAKSKLITKL